MKRSEYFYMFLLLEMLALIVYGFQNYFWIMIGLITFSSVFSFVVFLIETRIKLPASDADHQDEPVDFYKADKRTTYYITKQRKQVSAE